MFGCFELEVSYPEKKLNTSLLILRLIGGIEIGV